MTCEGREPRANACKRGMGFVKIIASFIAGMRAMCFNLELGPNEAVSRLRLRRLSWLSVRPDICRKLRTLTLNPKL